MIKTTIVGFGDSLTFGYGVRTKDNYLSRLEKFMPSYFPTIDWKVIHSGVNGDTTREGLMRVEKDVCQHHPNIVLILFGTNDSAMIEGQYRSPAEYTRNLREMVRLIRSQDNRTGLNHCQAIPVLITPPPVLEEVAAPFYSNEKILQYVEAVKEVAEETHCPLIDFYEYLTTESEGNIASCLQADGVHLSLLGYDHLYDRIFSELTKLIDYEGILKDYQI